ncbi:MAG: hypothetical protein F4Z61_01460 [Acidimicrobiia bacterium]|nr:hypothetical protein [Acidimicrobiia bacterium]
MQAENGEQATEAELTTRNEAAQPQLVAGRNLALILLGIGLALTALLTFARWRRSRPAAA